MDRDQHYWQPMFSHKIVRFYVVVSKPPKHNECHLLAMLGSRSLLVALRQLVKHFCQEMLPGQTDLHPKIPQVKLEGHLLNMMTFLQARQDHLGSAMILHPQHHLTPSTLMSPWWHGTPQHL
jgi:hypothetical protein